MGTELVSCKALKTRGQPWNPLKPVHHLLKVPKCAILNSLFAPESFNLASRYGSKTVRVQPESSW